MASSKRVSGISSLTVAITVALCCTAAAGPIDRDRMRASYEAEAAARYSEAVQRWLDKHGAPPTPRAPMTTFVRNCDDDGSSGTLRDVLDNVFTGDTVDMTHLTCNKITLMLGYLEPNPFATTFSIAGPGMDALTISGRNLTQIIYQSGDGVVYISDVSFADGYGLNSWGGCLIAYQIPNGGLNLTRVRVSNCVNHQINTYHGTDAFGGGIMVNGELTLVDSIVTGNTLSTELPQLTYPYANSLEGGGAFSLSGPVTVTNSVISYNQVLAPLVNTGIAAGGGLAVRASLHPVTITDSIISHNTISAVFDETSFMTGGGLHIYAGNPNVGNLVISNTTIDHNVIETSTNTRFIYGGGIDEAMPLTLSNSTISSNDAPAVLGGGIMARGLSASIIDSTISGNHAAGDGAGAFVTGNQNFIDNSTIAFNTSDNGVGGLAMNAPTTTRSSIVSGNATGGGFPDIGFLASGSLNGNHSFIGDPAGMTVPPDTLTGDPKLAPLADNGGPTLTHALQSGSPAIDAGSNQRHAEFDQRGPGYLREHGAAPDIGAFETVTLEEDTVFADGFDGG